MSRYLVTFFKHLPSSDGHIFKSPQQSIEICRAKSIERAVQAAERRYERLCNLPHWTFHADTLEVEVDDKKVDRAAPVAKVPTGRLTLSALTKSEISTSWLGCSSKTADF